ncbi:hypothetical protein FLA105534_03208 [Flavobacterium bizetiae]|uniref:Uncharacterized protein n=1 Tax=Flavobacterium bizetiae TaxID=2704140 RepID=A0A6J4GNN0_9FLAO|nr:hypothetical protein [Flavobacterium bizetiae]CAA9200713.1 hypothetical protein FLA105534_03208 [Flavobacterium bizetiae]CAD5342016.1 hypothetical protein FLA105535_01995 [Flavobacterium bizetiae]CAD5348282.1 hypothetical protein FLA105534_02243 [Flavobacterium bizetiae]
MKINYKIQFTLFIICLFFIALGIFQISNTGLKTGSDLFWQLSAFVPFVLSSIVFGMNLYSKRIKN